MVRSRFKALALLSGGLDSILAVKVIQLQDIDVEGIVFQSSFFNNHKVHNIASRLGIKIHPIDINKELIRIIEKPKYGFGKNINPCIDCHLLMISKACGLLKKYKADFIITGEVAGERPKSQNYRALQLISDQCGCGSLLLRPLSAKKLPETRVEEEGIVDREKLYGITGKNRKEQIVLAAKFGIDYYPQPAGGCLLTVPRFSDRLRINLKTKKLSGTDLALLKFGRHFLTKDEEKIIIGRDEEDNNRLSQAVPEGYLIFELDKAMGPLGVLCSTEYHAKENIIKTASLVVRYSKLRNEKTVRVKYFKKGGEVHFLSVSGKDHKELELEHI
ncbi:MAG: tRNA 4-thiouridine(8) synthase ThiI [Spirochaetes bacterium]|nr:tRNA 4-thiouridine(8) synthase ThiI [Spirochaetota bacterium]